MKEVGIRIKVGAAGLDNVDALIRQLKLAGAETEVFEKDANDLAQAMQRLGREQGLIDTFARAKREAGKAARSLEQAQAKTRELAIAFGQLETPTKRQTAEFERSRKAIVEAKEALQAKRLAVQDLRGQLQTAGIATDQLAAAQLRVHQQTRAVTAASQELRQRLQQGAESYRAQGAAAQASAAQQVTASRQVGGALQQLQGQLAGIRNLVGVALGGSLVGTLAADVARTADQFANLQARIKLVTGEGAAFEEGFASVRDIALATNTALETTGTLFARVLQSGRDIGVTQQQALELTNTINQAVQLSGASAEASDAAITQLLQGLSSGVLRGEEFNSVLEQSPRLAQALAQGLGVTIGQLRALAQEGQLSSETVIRALQGQADTVAAEFAKLPPTVGRAITNLGTAWSLYVGEVDRANGISQAAAGAINLLADNLDTLGAVLLAVGKAAAAYQALKLAQTFLGLGTAARAATVEVTALAAAQTAANASATAGAAAVGRLAAVISTLKTVTLVGVLANVGSLGTAIGETAARWAGWGRKLEDSEIALKADERASKANAEAKKRLAAETLRAAEEALGLTRGAKQLVGEFDAVIRNGGTAAEALEGVRKALNLGNLEGVNDAVTALEVLARTGRSTAAEVRAALSRAFDGRDLRVFETQARAALAGAANGAERLQLVLDAIREDSLERVGSSLRELETGFSEAFSRSANDTDILERSLQELGITGEQAGRLLARSLDKQLEVANTERALQSAIARIEELGRQGLISGDLLAQGLDKGKRKLDELRPGVSSLNEALRSFGLKSREELEDTAKRLGESWARIRSDTTVSLADKVQAFGQYRAAAVAANGGVESSTLAVERRMLESKAAATGLGQTIVQSMGNAQRATNQAYRELDAYTKLLLSDPSRLVSGESGLGTLDGDGRSGGVRSVLTGADSPFTAAGLAARNARVGAAAQANVNGIKYDPKTGMRVNDDGSTFTAGIVVPPPDGTGQWEWRYVADGSPGQDGFGNRWLPSANNAAAQAAGAQYTANMDAIRQAYTATGTPIPAGGFSTFRPTMPAAVRQYLDDPEGWQRAQQGGSGAGAIAFADSLYATPSAGAVTINVTIGRRDYTFGVANRQMAETVIETLEAAYRAGGWA